MKRSTYKIERFRMLYLRDRTDVSWQYSLVGREDGKERDVKRRKRGERLVGGLEKKTFNRGKRRWTNKMNEKFEIKDPDEPATDKQLALLKRLGVCTPQGLTKGQASELIDKAKGFAR